MKSFIVGCMYEDDECIEWPRFVVLGDRSVVLADRMIEYTKSISRIDCKPEPSEIRTDLFDPEACLAPSWVGEIFVAISGKLNPQEESLLERIVTRLGDDCFIVIDAETERRSNWRSVVQLPGYLTREAQWKRGMRTVLDLLLEAVLHRGFVCFDAMDIRTALSGQQCQFAVSAAEGEGRAAVATAAAARSLSQQLELATPDVVFLILYTGMDFKMKEFHQAKEALMDAFDWYDATVFVAHVLSEENRFAVSLIAGLPSDRH